MSAFVCLNTVDMLNKTVKFSIPSTFQSFDQLLPKLLSSYRVTMPPWALVSPANRGIGFHLTRHLLRNTTLPVVATTRRDIEGVKKSLLVDMPEIDSSRLNVFELDVTGNTYPTTQTHIRYHSLYEPESQEQETNSPKTSPQSAPPHPKPSPSSPPPHTTSTSPSQYPASSTRKSPPPNSIMPT